MSAFEVTSAEELTKGGTLRGRLSDVSLPEMLIFLKVSQKTGVLSFVQTGVRKALFFLEGRVVFAASSLSQDRLGEVLLRGGKISADEYLRLSQRIRGGQRLGKAMIESGVLAPRDLWWGIEQQVREIVWSLFSWEEGSFQFEESDRPRSEKITINLEVEALTVEGIRRISGTGTISNHFVPVDTILERTAKLSPVPLEPYEEHVLRQVNGKKTVAEICKDSEIGEAETRKVLHTFMAVAVIAVKGRKQAPLDPEAIERADYRGMVELYNQMYKYLFRHMSGEVGPIAEIILEKYLGELKGRPHSLFERVRLRRDGSLDPQQIELNVTRVKPFERRNRLVEALNELLYAELLAVKRTLGASHEAQLIKTFRTMRGDK
ncbi:MAG TPA: DUF4388 domain-containing protein [Vicinamibacteria bacterium]|nr:DUF4388 domain-containing protein [Vicinamibacteria bacterium]